MAYAANTDILLEFKGVTGWDASTVAATTVDEFCARASHIIDAKIAGKYKVPVDSTASPNSFSVLKEICCWMVRSRVSAILKTKTGDAKTSAGSETDWKKRADDMLADIQSGKMKLTDAVLATSADGVESFTNDNAATLQPPTFTREDDQW